MKRSGKICIAIFFIMMTQLCLTSAIATGKTKPKEVVRHFDDQMWVERKDYGLIAGNVSNVKIGTDSNLWEIFLKQRGKKEVKEVDLFHKKNGGTANYKMNIVFKNAKHYFPMIDRSLCVDEKNQLLLTGKDVCHLFAKHATEKECEKSFGKYRNQAVQKNIDGSRCWCDDDMFAYVQDDKLYLTGSAAASPGDECYKNETVKAFFEGKGNEIKEVVCGKCDGYGKSNIFVLMKDGSVWGMGSNKCKMISDSKQKYYPDFIKIIPKGGNMIAANSNNVAMIKKNGSLYVWGKTLKSREKIYSFHPKRIAKNVKEVSISDAQFEGGTVLVYLKKNKVAYGLGDNSQYALTDKCKKGWNSKAVMLRKNIKHVYAAPHATILLDNKANLYWTGTQDYYAQYDWVNKKVKP